MSHQLISTENFEVPNNVTVCRLFQSTTLQASEEEVSVRRVFWCVAKEICQRDLANLRVFIAQKGEQLESMSEGIYIRYVRLRDAYLPELCRRHFVSARS